LIISSTVTTRSARFGLRATPEQETVLHHAAEEHGTALAYGKHVILT